MPSVQLSNEKYLEQSSYVKALCHAAVRNRRAAPGLKFSRFSAPYADRLPSPNPSDF
jgi:hypothetical protein